ncbi:MAG TPA: SprT-like domain-containing protein [Fulvivirga sp.]|nr:SprT-like domain-containing protein [Fulvivirga sp.]
MIEAHSINKTLSKYIPLEALHYCTQLWIEQPFNLKIKKKRTTKLGDYRYLPANKTHQISINNDLNPYSFLVTYLHEVAHLKAFVTYGRQIKPHGLEWKATFKEITLPLLNSSVFPDDVLRKLARYMKDPKASSCNDHNLMRVLKGHDKEDSTFLADLEVGQMFKLGSRTFKKENLRRTRFVCQEVSTGRKYLISKTAVVEPLPESVVV